MKSAKKEQMYIVCMDSSYVRDAQMVDTSKLSNKEFKDGFFFCTAEYDDLWHDMEPTPFIGVVGAKNEKQACRIAADKYRYDVRCLYAVQIPQNREVNTK